MATKAASFARELKLIRSDLSFMQDRCALLEEENRRLRDGFDKGLRPEEDDLVRGLFPFFLFVIMIVLYEMSRVLVRHL